MSNRAEILRLARLRIKPCDIAERLKVPVTRVYHVCTKARGDGFEIPKFAAKGVQRLHHRVPLKPHVRDLLGAYAQQRGCDVIDLAETILDTVAEEDLVDAILDDGGAHAG